MIGVHLAWIIRLKIIKKYRISNLTGSAYSFRMFFGFKEKFDPSIKTHLRAVSSAGEP